MAVTDYRSTSFPRVSALAVCWFFWGALIVAYSAMAFEYFFAMIAGNREWWNQLQAMLVSESFSFGTGSVYAEQHEPYYFNRYLLLFHTTTGGVALAIGWTQFVSSWRKAYPKWHRGIGKLYLASILLSMTSGLMHLSTVSLRDVYSGAPFGLGLWGLDLTVIVTALLAFLAVKRRDFEQHQAWMAVNYALVCATPTLRIAWVTFGMTTDLTQAQINSGIATVLLPINLILAMIWLSSTRIGSARTASVA